MILVDKALAEREQNGNPIRVAIVGAGYSGRNIAYQIIHSFPGLRLVAIANRTLSAAQAALAGAGVTAVRTVDTAPALERAMRDQCVAITENAALLCEADGIDAVIEATGTVEFACGVALRAIEHRKHVILINVELDATLGPILKSY